MAVKFQDYYKTLGVSRKASPEEIQRAYRQLARKYHPDLNKGNKRAEKRFKALNEAHEVLKDPEKRKRYDLLGKDWKPGQSFRPPPGFDGFNFDCGVEDYTELQLSITEIQDRRAKEGGEE